MPEENEPTVEPAEPTPGLEPTPSEDDQLAAMRKQLESQQGELDRLKSAAAAPPPSPAPTQVTQQHSREDMEKQFWQDPLNTSMSIAKFAAAQAYEAARKDAGLTLETMAELAKEKVRSKDPQVFDKFAGEIEAMVATVPEQFRQNVNVWDRAFNSVKGAHMDEILKLKAAGRPPGSSDGPAPVGAKQGSPPKEKALSDDERTYARKLGLTDAEYRKGMDLLETTPNGQVVTKPDAFDQVMTFNSKDRALRLKEQRNA